jgi:SAM-dependent MidA family methyltransferase
MDATPGLRRDPQPDLDAVGEDVELVARIHAEIARDGPLTFARFMDLALYDPAGGYYRAEAARPGREGDFLTAPEAHPIFGAALSRAVADTWDRLGRPAPFVVREYGAGTGTLAVALLDELARERPDLAGTIRYQPVEAEPARLDALAARLSAAGHGPVLERSGGGSPEHLDAIEGFVLANEVLDALPTHRIVGRAGRLREVLVGSEGSAFVDVEAEPTTPDLEARLRADGVSLADGQRAEVCLAMNPWIQGVADGLRRGIVLFIDYGYPAQELYDPVRRRDGTLRAYLRHRVHDDPYLHVGRQDVTAHVDVSAVERAAVAAGLGHLGTTTQAEFLVGLGTESLLQAIQADAATTFEGYLAVRSALLRLLDPAAMGRFRVMGFGRHWPDGPRPAGFGYRLPPRSDREGVRAPEATGGGDHPGRPATPPDDTPE